MAPGKQVPVDIRKELPAAFQKEGYPASRLTKLSHGEIVAHRLDAAFIPNGLAIAWLKATADGRTSVCSASL